MDKYSIDPLLQSSMDEYPHSRVVPPSPIPQGPPPPIPQGPPLRLSDIKVGQRVQISQLSNICDTWILLRLDPIDSEEGTIMFIGKQPDKKFQALFNSGLSVGYVYNDSMYFE